MVNFPHVLNVGRLFRAIRDLFAWRSELDTLIVIKASDDCSNGFDLSKNSHLRRDHQDSIHHLRQQTLMIPRQDKLGHVDERFPFFAHA